uniref:O-methyltransferase n=1 Tax=Acrobeloides nanus TaxID=290746 RepID=A0A914EFQ1_9BILA
ETQAVQLPPPLVWKESATPEVVQLTMNLMSLYRPNRSLVIGVFTGLALIGVSSVTDPRGIVVGLEYPDLVHYWEKIGIKHAQRAGIMNRIQIRSVEGIERSLQKLAAYEPNAFDFILLDDVKKSNYLDDYEHSVRLLRNGGLLIITDALFNGAVLDGPDHISPDAKVVQAMNSRIKSDPRVTSSLLPFAGGTWVIVRK